MNDCQMKIPPLEEGDVYLGKYWAAFNHDHVVRLIKMRVPDNIDFDEFREKSLALLELFGHISSGHVVQRKGKHIFMKRLTHQNRTKKERKLKEFIIHGRIQIN